MGTGVEQGGAAKPRTKVSSGDFRSPRESPTTGTDIKPQKAQSFLGLFSFEAWARGSNRAARQSRALSRYAATIVPVASYRRYRAVMRDSVILSLALMLVEVFCFEMLPGQIISIFLRGAEVLAVGVPAFRNHLRQVRPGFVSAPDPPLAGCVKSQAAEKEFCAAAKTPLTSRY